MWPQLSAHAQLPEQVAQDHVFEDRPFKDLQRGKLHNLSGQPVLVPSSEH